MSAKIYGLCMRGTYDCFDGKRTIFSKKMYRSEAAAWAGKDEFVERAKPTEGVFSFTPTEMHCLEYELEDE